MPERFLTVQEAAETRLLETFADMIAVRVAAKLGAAEQAPVGKLLSIKDAAAIMGVSDKSLRHQMSSKHFPERAIRRFGRRILLDREVFQQWLSAH